MMNLGSYFLVNWIIVASQKYEGQFIVAVKNSPQYMQLENAE